MRHSPASAITSAASSSASSIAATRSSPVSRTVPASRPTSIIGADGFRSTVRALCAPEVRPSYAGYVAWRGIMEERDLSAEFRAHTFDQFAFCFPLRSQFIGYPVPGTDEFRGAVAAALQLPVVLPRRPGRRADRRPHRCERPHARILDPAAADPPGPHPAPQGECHGAAAAAVRRGGRALRAAHGAADLRRGVDADGLRPRRARSATPRSWQGRTSASACSRPARTPSSSPAASPAAPRSLQRSSRYQGARLPVARDTVRLGRRLGAFIERGLEGPWSDPDLGLVPQTIIRISARPVAHLELADLGPRIGRQSQAKEREPARLSVCTVTLVRADDKESMIRTR